MKKKFYFDDNDNEGLSSKTSHPKFKEIITEDFYFDCSDEFSPFGNDDGWDVLYSLEDWYKTKKNDGDILKWLYNKINGYGFKYDCVSVSKILDIKELNFILEDDEFLILCMDESIIAAAFGQYKIEGIINKDLKELGLIAIERQKIINQQILSTGELDMSKLLKVVDGVSTRPDAAGQTGYLNKQYLSRLEIMKADLLKFEAE